LVYLSHGIVEDFTTSSLMDGMEQWLVCLAHNRWMYASNESTKVHVVILSKTLYPHCLVLVSYRNRLERNLHKLNVFVSQSN